MNNNKRQALEVLAGSYVKRVNLVTEQGCEKLVLEVERVRGRQHEEATIQFASYHGDPALEGFVMEWTVRHG